MTTCMMTYPPARCTLPVGHDGPHATRDGYGWHDSDDMGVGVTAALIEKEATTSQGQDRQSLIDHIQEQDRIIRKRNGQIKRMEGAEMRAEKATAQLHDALDEQVKLTRERDEALRTVQEVVDSHDETLRDIAAGKYAAEPRPITPDAITDEMVKRAWHRALDFPTLSSATRSAVFAVLVAALTEPPARPEGAYELEAVIGLNAGKWTNGAEDVRALADLLASRGVRAMEAE